MERYVLKSEWPMPPSERERIAEAWQSWMVKSQPSLLILDRGLQLERIEELSKGWHCEFCGVLNSIQRERCSGCNAPFRAIQEEC